MYGAEKAASITHGLETILERARRGALKLNDEAFDCLFDGSAYLEEVVAALLKTQTPPEAPEKLTKGLEKFDQPKETANISNIDIDNTQIELDSTGEFYLSSRRRDGTSLLNCRIEFNPGNQPHFLVAYLILRRIQHVADVLGSAPTMTDIEAGICDGKIVILFAPRNEKTALIKDLEENLKKHYGVTKFTATTFA